MRDVYKYRDIDKYNFPQLFIKTLKIAQIFQLNDSILGEFMLRK